MEGSEPGPFPVRQVTGRVPVVADSAPRRGQEKAEKVQQCRFPRSRWASHCGYGTCRKLICQVLEQLLAVAGIREAKVLDTNHWPSSSSGRRRESPATTPLTTARPLVATRIVTLRSVPSANRTETSPEGALVSAATGTTGPLVSAMTMTSAGKLVRSPRAVSYTHLRAHETVLD